MKALTDSQSKLLNLLQVGESAIVVTSQYATIYNNPNNLPIYYSTAPAIRGLVARGLLTAKQFWRAADVTRIA